MKAAFTLLAFVACAIAGGDSGKDHDKDKGYPVVTYGPPAYVPTTKTVDVVYVCESNTDSLPFHGLELTTELQTTVCPVTETINYPGKTITTTYTTTSVVYTKIV